MQKMNTFPDFPPDVPAMLLKDLPEPQRYIVETLSTNKQQLKWLMEKTVEVNNVVCEHSDTIKFVTPKIEDAHQKATAHDKLISEILKKPFVWGGIVFIAGISTFVSTVIGKLINS